jgi:hypothetical protein
MKHIPSYVKRSAVASAMLTLSAGMVLAQTQDASSMLTTASSTLKTSASPLINLVSIIIGMVGVIMLVPTFVKYAKGEPTSADAFLKHGGGLVIVFVLLQLIRLIFLS